MVLPYTSLQVPRSKGFFFFLQSKCRSPPTKGPKVREEKGGKKTMVAVMEPQSWKGTKSINKNITLTSGLKCALKKNR